MQSLKGSKEGKGRINRKKGKKEEKEGTREKGEREKRRKNSYLVGIMNLPCIMVHLYKVVAQNTLRNFEGSRSFS